MNIGSPCYTNKLDSTSVKSTISRSPDGHLHDTAYTAMDCNPMIRAVVKIKVLSLVESRDEPVSED